MVHTLHYMNKYILMKYISSAAAKSSIFYKIVKYIIRHTSCRCNQHFKQSMHVLKHSSWQVSYCYMFRHHGVNLTEC